MKTLKSIIAAILLINTFSGVNAMVAEFENDKDYFDPSLAFEIRTNEAFDLQALEEALKYRKNIEIDKYKKDTKIKSNSVKNLIEMCLNRILQKNYNCGDNEAVRYQKFIITILPIYDKFEEKNQIIIKYTLLEIYRHLSY